ncbi:MAG: hypothetical protein F4W90_08050 [Gammaproteobacteria bacterium]|nr:hypothetical protein [Gammaproteobacteria bacterium]
MANEQDTSSLTIQADDYVELYQLMDHLRGTHQEALFIPVLKLQLAYLETTWPYFAESEPEHALEIRRFQRRTAFNIASFTWPGWDDSSEPISDARQQLGLQAAQRGLAIAEQIDEVTPNILWILAMHQINAGQFDGAVASLARAKLLAESEFLREMHAAWQYFALAAKKGDESSVDTLNQSIQRLRDWDDEYNDFYADQLVTAKGVYLTGE